MGKMRLFAARAGVKLALVMSRLCEMGLL